MSGSPAGRPPRYRTIPERHRFFWAQAERDIGAEGSPSAWVSQPLPAALRVARPGTTLMHAFEPCPDCARHVRVDARDCPFCGAAVALEARPVRRPPRRLGRAAIFAARTVLIGATGAACGSATGLEDPIHRSDAGSAPLADAASPSRADAGVERIDAGWEPDAGRDAGGSVALYGAPAPVIDAGEAPLYGGPPSEDAGTDAGPGVVPAYGAPAPG